MRLQNLILKINREEYFYKNYLNITNVDIA